MIEALIGWLVSNVGGALLVGIAWLGSLLAIYFKARADAQATSRARQAEQTLEDVKQKVASDATVDSLTPDDRRRRLRRWSSSR